MVNRTENGIGIGPALKNTDGHVCLSHWTRTLTGRVEEASLGGFISKYMRENGKGEVMEHPPKEKQTLKLTSEEV